MQDTLPNHDVVHVISDLHMGGEAGFQILREAPRLANYILRLATERPEKAVALVLNGDVFDTLAEDLHGDYVAKELAEKVVSRIMEDSAFKPIWDALSTFARTDNRSLVFVIGNHDIEISFPGVQRLIRQALSGGDPAANGRIEFSTNGAGYTCKVGNARVYCTHGNEFDAWNFNRYEDLARLGRRLNSGRKTDSIDWQPNAGTKMVKEVMNSVKRRYAWIDLLKPENSAAIGTLLAIDASQTKKLGEIVGVVSTLVEGKQEIDGRLSGTSSPSTIPATSGPDALEKLIGPNLREAMKKTPAADDMLLAAEPQRGGAAQHQEDGTLGTVGLLWDRLTGWLTGISKEEALRRALQDWLKDDKTFKLDNQDETCTDTLKNIGDGIDVVVTGHTHLARAIDLGGNRLYFNSGTWIRLMKFTEAMLKDEDSFKPVFAALTDGKMSTLDSTTIAGEPLVMDCTTEIELVADGGALIGRLNRIIGDGTVSPQTIQELKRG